MSFPDLSRELLLEMLASVSETVALVDEDLDIRYVNSPPKEMGFTAEELRGSPALDFVPPEHRDAQRDRLHRVLDTAEEATFELAILDREGAVRWVEGTLSPIERDGRVVGIVSVTKDVTDRRLAEEEAERFRTLIPICSWCGKIRDDDGYWSKVETYVEERSGSRVTHGMCPDCEQGVEGNGTDGPG